MSLYINLYQPGKGCFEFIYGGCGGNKNQFGSEEECMKQCTITDTTGTTTTTITTTTTTTAICDSILLLLSCI